jgi:hypothetical protein
VPGKWTTFEPPSKFGSFNSETMLLLTDGSVLFHQSEGENWLRLTPDGEGNYKSGEWSGLLKMANSRQFFSSGILKDGRVYVVGGEVSNAGGDTPLAEIFDPQTNEWSKLAKPASFGYIQGDASGCILPDGRVLMGDLQTGPPFTALWDPVTNVWTEAGTNFGAKADTKRSNCNEETWTLLPDGSVLAVATLNAPKAERYVPSLDEWVPAGETPSNLVLTEITDPEKVNVSISEIGPAILLPSGEVFAIGGTGQTALYTQPSKPAGEGKWTGAEAFPADKSKGAVWPTLTVSDGPAVLLPNGNVLCVAGRLFEKIERNEKGEITSRDYFSEQAQLFQFNPSSGSIKAFSPQPFSTSSAPETWPCRFLLLPTGQVLLTTQGREIFLYTPEASENKPKASWRPKLENPPTTLVPGHVYTLEGTQLNGLSQANSYGDDAQMATNYPLVRLTNSKGKVEYLRTFNFSTQGVATEGASVSAEFEVPPKLAPGAWSMVAIANAIESEPVEVEVSQQDCLLTLERDTFAEGEIKAIIKLGGAPAVINPALYVIVEGYTAEQAGLTAANLANPPNKPQIAEPLKGIKATFVGPVLPEDASVPAKEVQRFTFPFELSFEGTNVFAGAPETLTVTAKFAPPKQPAVEAHAPIFLTAKPNPFILHGDVKAGYEWYLSADLRVFHMKGGDTRFGATLESGGTPRKAATAFIQEVIENLNSDIAAAGPLFEKISQEEDVSETELALEPKDGSGNRLYNFALARVRMEDVAAAKDVGVFFRMWQAQQTNASFNANTIYKSVENPEKVPISVIGVEGDEIVTIPFFAAERVNTAVESMAKQTDPLNRRTIKPDKLGAEAFAYFGCWLDINQPGEKWFPDRLVGGTPAEIPAGPYIGMGELRSVQQLVRSTHQCVIAEINYSGDPIPKGVDPSDSDKLAQRNLTLVPVPNPGAPGSRVAPQTLEIRPTPVPLFPGFRPDELMIEWGAIPAGSTAELFLPGTEASEILETAAEMYATHRLTHIDPYTVGIEAAHRGVSFVPIPASAAGLNFMGLLSVNLPAGISKGQHFDVVVKQLTSAGARLEQRGLESELAAAVGKGFTWRRVKGVFKLEIPVGTKGSLLERERRTLSIMRWIAESVPLESRWYPVFVRYLEQLGVRVEEMGGNPVEVLPNPTGEWHEAGGGREEREEREEREGREGKGHGRCDADIETTGKVVGLVHDRFGDFEAFLLQELRCGEILRFYTRHRAMAETVEFAWRDQVTVSVFTTVHERHVPVVVVLREPPVV